MARPNIQRDILSAARSLFNRQGYASVTMRQIADSVGISPGNLTYHFARKQDIVTALMADAFENTLVNDPVDSLRQVNDMFARMLRTILTNPFYFLDAAFWDAQSHRTHNGQIRQRLCAGLGRLVDQGLFVPALTKDRIEALVQVLLMTHMTWLRNTVRGSETMTEGDLLRLHWLVLEPYFTPKGAAEYAEMQKSPPFV